MSETSEREAAIQEIQERKIEYDAALADLDFETGAGWFRVDAARDELIGCLGLDPGGDEPPGLTWLLAELAAARALLAAHDHALLRHEEREGKLREALREEHEDCGCDRPGNPSACIKGPHFAALSEGEG